MTLQRRIRRLEESWTRTPQRLAIAEWLTGETTQQTCTRLRKECSLGNRRYHYLRDKGTMSIKTRLERLEDEQQSTKNVFVWCRRPRPMTRQSACLRGLPRRHSA